MAHENEQEWTVERNGNYSRKDTTSGWVLRYQPNPGGKVNEDGSVTHSMSFPALALTCWIGDAENAAKQLAADLNEVNTLRAERDALREENGRLNAGGWQPIETAPKDTPIVGWCVHSADEYSLEAGGLTTYGAHAEGLGYVQDGPHVVVWGGEFDDPDDGYIPSWWFRFGSEWEEVANPTHWMPLPKGPQS